MAAITLTTSVIDVNGATVLLTGDCTKLIRYHSIAQAEMDSTSQGSLSNDYSYVINNGSKKWGTVCTFGNDPKDPLVNNVFTFYGEDEFLNEGTATVTAPMVNYVKLTCDITNSKPDVNGNMTLSCSGRYFNGSFGEQNNSLTVTYSYTGSDGSRDSGTMKVTKYSNNSYYAYVNLSDLDYRATYSFTVTAEDKLEEVIKTTDAVMSLPTFHWGKNDFTFEVPVKINGDTLYIGDNCYIREATDNDLTIKATELILNADSISLNADISTPYGSIECGEWTPQLYPPDAVNGRYEVQKGWYQKVGNVVTIGWQIKADTKSTYNSSLVMIMDFDEKLPLPSSDAFGGGVAFNVYTTEDFIFEGWAINTSGIITARLQPCEKYESGNLQISSGAFYPIAADKMQVSLAGTICYLTNG